MAVEIFDNGSNNVATSLAAALSPSSTTLTTVGTTYPTLVNPGDYFRGVLTPQAAPGSVFEYVVCTAVNSNTLTVVRGQEGSTALSWSIGDIFYVTDTAASLNNFLQKSTIGGYVTSFNGRSGAVTLQSSDISGALGYVPPSPPIGSSILAGNGAGNFANVTIGAGLTFVGGVLAANGAGIGTVTSVSIVSANGFAGTVATPTTTPAITLTTTINGIVYGNGTSFNPVTIGAGLNFAAGTLSATNLGVTIQDDTTTAATFYPLFADTTSGTASTVYTSSTELTYDPSTGELDAVALKATNGIVFNANVVTQSVNIPAGVNGLSAGPITAPPGVHVTTAPGSAWVVV